MERAVGHGGLNLGITGHSLAPVLRTVYCIVEKTRRWLAGPANDATPPNFVEETFVNSHKTLKFVKVSFLKCFPLYRNLVSQLYFLHFWWEE